MKNKVVNWSIPVQVQGRVQYIPFLQFLQVIQSSGYNSASTGGIPTTTVGRGKKRKGQQGINQGIGGGQNLHQLQGLLTKILTVLQPNVLTNGQFSSGRKGRQHGVMNAFS